MHTNYEFEHILDIRNPCWTHSSTRHLSIRLTSKMVETACWYVWRRRWRHFLQKTSIQIVDSTSFLSNKKNHKFRSNNWYPECAVSCGVTSVPTSARLLKLFLHRTLKSWMVHFNIRKRTWIEGIFLLQLFDYSLMANFYGARNKSDVVR